jgi:FkbM family methyltransferase
MLKPFLLKHPRLLATVADLVALRRGCRVALRHRDQHTYFEIRSSGAEIRLASHHGAYLGDMIREFEYYHDSVASRSHGDRLVADFSRPALHYVPRVGREVFFTSLAEGDDTNGVYLKTFKLREGDVVIDGGAYCGLTSLLFSNSVGASGRVIAVEADPQNFRALEENLVRWKLGNVRSHHIAIWNEDGEIAFESEGNMGSAAIAVGPRQTRVTKVPAMTLSSLAAYHGLERVDHVKLDVEGAEYVIVPSCQDFIEKFRPTFLLEVHRGPTGRVELASLASQFEALGYHVSRVRQSEREAFPLLHCVPKG